MYSKELEEFIDIILADGVITDKERELIHKKALQEGIDSDEIDIVIDGRLARQLKEDLLKSPKPSTDKHGKVSKCPNCGSVRVAGSVACSECGYEFRGVKANNSVGTLSKQIREAELEAGSFGLFNLFSTSKRVSLVSSAINNFPVPTAKEDLIEFILFLEPKIRSTSSDDRGDAQIANAYKKKYRECIQKAQVFFKDDPMFQPLFRQYEQNSKFRWRNLSFITRVMIIYFLILFVVVTLIVIYV